MSRTPEVVLFHLQNNTFDNVMEQQVTKLQVRHHREIAMYLTNVASHGGDLGKWDGPGKWDAVWDALGLFRNTYRCPPEAIEVSALARECDGVAAVALAPTNPCETIVLVQQRASACACGCSSFCGVSMAARVSLAACVSCVLSAAACVSAAGDVLVAASSSSAQKERSPMF